MKEENCETGLCDVLKTFKQVVFVVNKMESEEYQWVEGIKKWKNKK